MRLFHRIQAGLLAVALLGLSGCGAKLNYKETVTVEPDEAYQRRTFDGPLVEKATLTIKSPGVNVSAYVVLASNSEAAVKAFKLGQTPKDVLTSKEKMQDATFEVAPGKKPFDLFLVPAEGKKAEVSVTATGK